jgi:hypothetical protein
MNKNLINFFFQSIVGLMVLGYNHDLVLAASADCTAMRMPKDIPTVIEQVSVHLREAVNAANISVRLGAEQNKKRFDYQDKCIAAIDLVEKLLQCIGSSNEHQNIINSTIADSGGGFLSSGRVSKYLREVQFLGVQRLANDLKVWKENLHSIDGSYRLLQEEDIGNGLVNESSSPNLMSNILFWEQFQRSSSPYFEETMALSEAFGSLYARFAMISGEEMSIPERITYYGGLIPTSKGWGRWITDCLGLSKSQKEQDDRPVDRAFCAEFSIKLQEVLVQINVMKKLVLLLKPHIILERQGTPTAEKRSYSNAVSLLMEIEEDIDILKTELDDQLALRAEDIDPLSMGFVSSIFRLSMRRLCEIDSNLREATSGWSNRGSLTDLQKNDLAAIRNHDNLLLGAETSLYNNYVTCIEKIKQMLPSENLDKYCATLVEHLKQFQLHRKNKFVWPKDPPIPRESGKSFILELLSLNHARECVEWLASTGFPPAIEYIKNAAGVIDEAVTNFEKTRVILAQELQNVKSIRQRLMPVVSLAAIAKGYTVKDALIDGDYDSRSKYVFEEYRKDLLQNNQNEITLVKSQGNILKSHIIQYANMVNELSNPCDYYMGVIQRFRDFIHPQYSTKERVRLWRLLRQVYGDVDNPVKMTRLCYFLAGKNDYRCDLFEKLYERRLELKDYRLLRLISHINDDLQGKYQADHKPKLLIDSTSWLRFVRKNTENIKLPDTFLNQWGNQWDLYVKDNPQNIHLLPIVFRSIARIQCDKKRQIYNQRIEKYDKSEKKQEQVAKALVKYSFFTKMCAPLAKWCGLKWGKDVCKLKVNFNKAVVLTDNCYRDMIDIFNSYKEYNNLLYVAKKAEDSMYNGFVGQRPIINMTESIFERYFSFP